jgi:broad specificity phosphatase PhoE
VAAGVFIPWAATDWTAAGRLPAEAALPLCPAGVNQASAWGLDLARRDVRVLYCSAEQTGQETAGAVARASGMKVRTMAELAELDFGLWGGLTEDVLRARFPRVYKRWLEEPSAICPPEGEPLEAARDRLREALERILRKSRGPAGVVAGPYAVAIFRTIVLPAPLNRLRHLLTSEPVWYDAPVVGQAPSPGRINAA